MNEDDQLHEIPKEFYSYATGAPFTNCIECDCDLSDKEYFIEKAFRTYPGFKAKDVIFELAICAQCAERLRQTMSQDSMIKLAEYMQKNTNATTRMEMMQQYPDNPEKWTDKCLVSGTLKEDATEYQVYAQCLGSHITIDLMPYMISGDILDEMSQLLSNKTLGEMDDFMGRHFGPPSLAKELPNRRTVLI